MKKLINQPDDVVQRGAGRHGGRARRRPARRSTTRIYRPRRRARRRARSASSPAAAPATSRCTAASSGRGMLDAACPGEVFTSPTPDQMLAATQAVDGGAGVLHIVKNYTGDVMNFEMAAELRAWPRASRSSRSSSTTTSPSRTASTPPGRRGVGVTVLAEKICGAAAERGYDLARRGRRSAARSTSSGRSMGMALTSCTVPAAGKPTFDLAEDEMEMGIGIHGEPGRERGPLATARARSPSVLVGADRRRPARPSAATAVHRRSSTAWAARR